MPQSGTEEALRKIRAHWQAASRAQRDERGLCPTAPDPYLQDLIEEAILEHLRPETRLLDIGCGDGSSTLRFASLTGSAVGVDYLTEFVQRAQRNADEQATRSAIFAKADACDLSSVARDYGTFDVAVTIRCLINLPTWELQAQALEQIAGIVKSGGMYLVSEGWSEGIEALNARRARAGLAPIEIAVFNRFIARRKFEEEAKKYFDIVDYVNLGFYLFMSRLFQPLYTRPNSPFHTHPVNRIAAEALKSGCVDEAFADCDYAGVYVLRRLEGQRRGKA